MWKIKAYKNAAGKCEVKQKYERGNDDFQAEFDVAAEYLRGIPREQWQRPHVAKLKNCKKFRDFFEIRIFVNRVQERPIGFFGPGTGEFTIVLWAIEKGDELIPEKWCEIANDRRQAILDGRATAVPMTGDDEEHSQSGMPRVGSNHEPNKAQETAKKAVPKRLR